jgi:uncharacterized protein YecE (DUF72 family)
MIPYIGTSGYSYKSWKGSFYPEDLPNKEMLRYYGERFRSVEINNTFYRMPSEKVLTDWHDQVPDGFAFVLKASRRITHFKRLKDAGEELSYVLRTSSVLQKKLGPTLLQLPPNFKKDLPRLQDFLKQLPQGWRAAVEFRHASWFEDDVYETLRDHNVAMVIAETDEETVPIVCRSSRRRAGATSASGVRATINNSWPSG